MFNKVIFVAVFVSVIMALFMVSCSSHDGVLTEQAKIKIVKEIKAVHDSIIRGFNQHDAAKILRYIDKNDSLRYVEHTQVTIGWNNLKDGFEKWHKANNSLSLELHQSYVNILSKDVAILISAGAILRDSVYIQKFTWTAVFQNKGNGWKIYNAHEAFSDY